MKKLLIILPLLVTGCVNATTVYEDKETKRAAVCNAVAFGLIASIATEIKYQKCKEKYERQGYKEASR
jgi:hypothetical protein